MDAEEAVIRKVKSLLNKITPEKFDKIGDEIRSIFVDNGDYLDNLITLIFDKGGVGSILIFSSFY